MRLLWYGENPWVPTGAAQVAAHLLPVFQEVFEDIHLVPINQNWCEAALLPPGLRVTPAPVEARNEELYNIENAKRLILEGEYDVLFLTTDMNWFTDMTAEIKHAYEQGKHIIMYAAMDCHIYDPNVVAVAAYAHEFIVFSEWCKRFVAVVNPPLAERTKVIYHGTEPEVFYPFSADERRAARRDIFGLDDDMFLVMNVNRNQARKDLARSMAAFHLFHREHPNSRLYLHAKQKDLGGNLPAQAYQLGLQVVGPEAEVIFTPPDFREVSRADLNRIYNCADVCISTCSGEGWGLTTTEAMAAGVPFIGPDNTVFPEIIGYYGSGMNNGFHVGLRGSLVEAGGPDLWVTLYGIADNPRELCSTTGMKNAISHVHKFPDFAKERAERARAWTLEHTWTSVQDQWRGIFASLKEKVLA